MLKKKHPSPSWKRQNKTHTQTHHIEIVKMRVWKELVRAVGEGVTPRVGRVSERGLHRGQCAEDERGGSAQMPALVSQRDYRCLPLGMIGSTRCCQHLRTCTVCVLAEAGRGSLSHWGSKWLGGTMWAVGTGRWGPRQEQQGSISAAQVCWTYSLLWGLVRSCEVAQFLPGMSSVT